MALAKFRPSYAESSCRLRCHLALRRVSKLAAPALVETTPACSQSCFGRSLEGTGPSPSSRKSVGRWTRELIDLSLQHGGRYYLPYQLHATGQQFESAYPEVAQLRRLKRRLDPDGKFSNELWRKYL